MDENLQLLKYMTRQDIVKVLIGESTVGQLSFPGIGFIDVQLPNLSKTKIDLLFMDFDLAPPPRIKIEKFIELLHVCIANNLFSRLLVKLFSEENFQVILSKFPRDEKHIVYSKIIDAILEKINSYLKFDGVKLSKHGDKYYMSRLDEVIELDLGEIPESGMTFIQSSLDNIQQDISNHKYDSALTRICSMVEGVCKKILDAHNIKPEKGGSISTIFNQVKTCLRMNPGEHDDMKLKKLLSGLNTIVTTIYEMRNVAGIAHANPNAASLYKFEAYHIRFYLNAALTACAFMLSSSERKLSKSK